MATPEEAMLLAQDGLNNVQIGARLGVSRDAVRRLLNKAGYDRDRQDTVTVDADRLGDVEGLLRERGLEPADWVVTNVVVNRWEGFVKNEDAEPVRVPLKQLKVFLRRKVTAAMLMPVDPKPLKFPATKTLQRQRGSRLVFVYGDDQRPNHDPGFEQTKLAWCAANQPDLIVDLGDGMDFPTVSQHKPNPACNWSVQQCADSYASWLYSVRRACPVAEIVLLADNHVTQRFRDYQLSQASALYGVKPADVDGLAAELEPLLSIRRLLRLDEMNVTYLQPDGDTHYAESQLEIVPGELVAIHGYRTGANVGRKFLDDYGVSVCYGHVHGQDVYVTDVRRRRVGKRERLYALGVGCGVRVHGGNGFAPGADWANCALAVTVHPDGGWTWDYLNYQDGVLRWRDQAYVADAERLAA